MLKAAIIMIAYYRRMPMRVSHRRYRPTYITEVVLSIS